MYVLDQNLGRNMDGANGERIYTDYFDHFNNIFPLMDHKEVEAQMSIQLCPDPAEDVAWYAAINMVFAIGSLLERLSLRGRSEVGLMIDPTDLKFARSWGYFSNCCSVLPDLLFQDTNLTGLAALVAMVGNH